MLAPRVVLAAHAGHHVQEVDVAAAVGVAVALTVCRRTGGHSWGQGPGVPSLMLGAGEEPLCPGEYHGQSRAGLCWAGGWQQVCTAMGGSGWKLSLRECSGVRVPVILRCGQAGASPLQSQDMISFRNCIVMGAGNGGESGVNYRAALLMSRALRLGLEDL